MNHTPTVRPSFLLPIFILSACLTATPAALAQDSPVVLDSIVVSVYRLPVDLAATSASVTVLDGDELAARNVATVVEALRTVPGLAVSQSGSYGSTASVFLRGGESDYVAVMIDGVQVNEPGGRFDFANLLVAQIDRIEIVRGPVSSMYGSDAVGGLIQIFTRTGEGRPHGSVTVQGGTYDSWRGTASVHGGAGIAAYGVAVSALRSDGIQAFNNDYDNLSFSGQVKLAPDERTDLRLSAHYSDHTYHFPTDGGGALVDENQNTFGDELTLGLDARRRLSPAVELALLLGARDAESGSDDRPDGPADTLGFHTFQSLDDVRRLSADARANFDLGTAGRGSAGVELEEQRTRSFSDSDSEFGPSSSSSDHERSNAAYYGQWLGRWGGLALNGSLRVEDNEAFGGLVSYSAGTAYRFEGSATKLRTTLGRGIKEPSLFENFATGFARGNPDLEPERSFSLEAGIDQYLFEERFRVSATYFDQSFEDLIQFTFTPPDPTGPNYFNVAAADARGVEAEAAATLGGFAVSAGYTWLDTKVVDAGFDEGEDATFVEGDRLLRRPTHQLSAGVRRGFGASGATPGAIRGLAGVEVRHVGDRVDRDFAAFPTRRAALPSYTVVDVYGEISPLASLLSDLGLTITARIENLFDEDYAEARGFPAPGRTIWLGLRAVTGGATGAASAGAEAAAESGGAP
jgi:vitamin B12 transporter